MTLRPVVLSPATPSELLNYIILYHKYPTTLVVGCSKGDFSATLIDEIKGEISRPSTQDEELESEKPRGQQHVFLRPPTLLQLAVSRHTRIVFTPTVAHFRAWMATFSAGESRIPAPPNLKPEDHMPHLIVYGLLELHRGASEWSAQGLGNSAAVLVSGASRNAFKPVVVEPRGAGGHETLQQFLEDQVPLLNGSQRKDDGSWSGRTVTVQRTLSRWFEFEARNWSLK